MSLIGNPDTPSSYVADYMQACVGMFGIPAGGFTDTLEAYGDATDWNVESLYAAMLNSSIGRSIYAPGVSNETFATKLVAKLGGSLLADADEAAAIDVVKAALDGGMSLAAAAMASVEFVAALETSDTTYGAVAQQFQNRIEIANYYTFNGTNPSSTMSTLQGVLSTVTNTTDVSNPEQVLNTITEPGVSTGQTYTLTTNIDNIVGTTGNDTIIGDNSGTSATSTAGDQVAGGSGTDTFKLYAKAGTAPVLPSLSGVEVLHVIGDNKGLDGANATNISGMAGVTTYVAETDGAKNTYTMGAGDTFKMLKDTGAIGADVVYNAADTSTTLYVDTVGKTTTNSAVDLKGTSLATITIDATNANYVVMNNSAGVAVTTKVLVTGSGSLTLDAVTTADLTGLKTVDASANTGGVKFVAPTSNLTFTGGSGNDQVTFAAGTFTADDKLVGGSGTDVIAIADTAVKATTDNALKGINASSGFETVALGAASSTVDFALITSGITNVRLDVAGKQTLNNTTNATTVEVAAGVTVGAADLAIANKLGQTTTNIKMDATSAGASSVAQLVLTGVSNINVESDFSGSGAQGTANTLTVKTQADNSVFTVSGDHALNLTLKSAATATGSTVDASALTKTLTVVGTDKADAITGGSGNDSFIGNTDGAASGADTLTGGAGNDSFKFDALSIGTGNMSTITDFTKGDKLVLDLSGGAGAFVTAKVDVSAAATLADAVGLADGTAKNVSWFVFGTDTYVVSAGATTNAVTDDTIVKLTGVLDLSTSTFTSASDTLVFA